MDFKKFIEEVVPLVGGTENINSYANCMTRLRINVNDTERVNIQAIKKLDGVMGVVAGEQVQIIVGPGNAQRAKDTMEIYYKELEIKGVDIVTGYDYNKNNDDDLDIDTMSKDQKSKYKNKQTHRIQKTLARVGNIFIPLIPGFVGAGLILALGNTLKTMYISRAIIPNGIDPTTITNADLPAWIALIIAIGGTMTASLNIFTGWNAAKEYGGTPVLGGIAGAILYLPLLSNTGYGEPLYQFTIFGYEISSATALGGIIGVILAGWLFATIEKSIRKITPPSLDLFIVPTVTILLGSFISILIIQPIAGIFMSALTWLLIDVCLVKGGIIGGFLVSAAFLPMVLLGVHQALTPVHLQLITDYGYTVLLPFLAMGGAGQVGMAIAVYVKTKYKPLKTITGSALPVGFLGVGEPLIYGVSLPLGRPFISACLGSGCAGVYLSIATKIHGDIGAIALGTSGILLTPLINEGMKKYYLIALFIAYGAGFLITYFWGFNDSMTEKIK